MVKRLRIKLLNTATGAVVEAVAQADIEPGQHFFVIYSEDDTEPGAVRQFACGEVELGKTVTP